MEVKWDHSTNTSWLRAIIIGTGSRDNRYWPPSDPSFRGTDRRTNVVSLPGRLLPTLVVSLPVVSHTQLPLSSRVTPGPSTCRLLTCHSFSPASPSPRPLSLSRVSPALAPAQSLCTSSAISRHLEPLPLPTWTLRSGASAVCGDKFVFCTCPGTTSHCLGKLNTKPQPWSQQTGPAPLILRGLCGAFLSFFL